MHNSALAQMHPPIRELRCRVSFRALDSFPIRAGSTVTIVCKGHILDLVSKAGHLKLPPGTTLAVEHCNLLTYVDWHDSLAASEPSPDSGPASFLGSASDAVFRARNSSVQYAHVVRRCGSSTCEPAVERAL